MQILMVVNGRTDWAIELRQAIQEELDALSWPRDQVEILENDAVTKFDPKTSTMGPVESSVVLYLHDPVRKPGDPTLLAPWIDDERCFPVVEDIDEAGSLPEPLDKLNACPVEADDEARFALVVEHALTRLLLTRLDRKVFLSYRRIDSAESAEDLQTRLIRRKYDVFLDVGSIPFAVDAQRRVHAAIADADAVLLLASPSMESSEWVMEEVTLARRANVPLIVALWPEYRFPNGEHPAFVGTIDSDNRLDLDDSAFEDSKATVLTDDALDDIIRRLERNRVGAIIQRTRELRAVLLDALPDDGTHECHVDRPSDVYIYDDKSKTNLRKVVRVLPFRPTSDTVHDLSQSLGTGPEAPEEALLFYYEPALSHDANVSLHWLLDVDRDGKPKRFGLCNPLVTPEKEVLA